MSEYVVVNSAERIRPLRELNLRKSSIMPLRHLTPFAFLALLPLGGWLGGAWTFSAAAATPLCLASLDWLLGEDEARPDASSAETPRWIARAYVVLQLLATTWAAIFAVTKASQLEAIGLAVSAGVLSGVFGFVAAHEMIHSRSPRERALGLAFLASVFYLHFRIAHIYGHHRRAGTIEDPATARLGESLYAFLIRSLGGQFREAWMFEGRRRRPVIGAGNRMINYLAFEAIFLILLALLSWRALVFLAAVAMIAVILLESFNYVAHYGLRRQFEERLGPHHSWNSRRRMNNAALFNMGRHSDHHRRMTRSYEALEPVAAAAELPSGYAGAMLAALVPPLWRHLMDPRARAVMAAELEQS
jgi:alkane 1-monooxygenase